MTAKEQGLLRECFSCGTIHGGALCCGPIERDPKMERDYIPMPGGWEIQTKGKGSTFRICDKDGDRLAIPDSPYLHETLERMAREVNAAALASDTGERGVVEAWDEGYRTGVNDERMSEANIGIAGFDAKVEPARENPYRRTPPESGGQGQGSEVVGHKTLDDGRGGFRHEPLTRAEADVLIAHCKSEDERRKALMPDQRSAIRMMMDAHTRLTDMGWKDPVYCPKDGRTFEVIEPGSTGIHKCMYMGEWPSGSWWVLDAGDMYPSRPVLFRSIPAAPAQPDGVKK